MGKASNSIVDPTLLLLQSLHVEVQYEACELIKDLMHYDVKEDAMQRLVSLLHPTAADIEKIPEAFNGELDLALSLGVLITVHQCRNADGRGVLTSDFNKASNINELNTDSSARRFSIKIFMCQFFWNIDMIF